MGNRLSKIYTRTGDGGETGLGDGSRVPKDSLRVEAYGCVDELSSVLGLLLTQTLPDADRERLVEVQHRLLDLGGELCTPGYEMITAGQVEALEQWLDALNAELPPLKEFILPGGAPASAWCHLARTVCRRAERRVVSLQRAGETINPAGLRYLNRLSDLLFVLARSLDRAAGGTDQLWAHERRPKPRA